MVSSSHQICAKGIFVAIISATVETENPEEEIAPAVELLGGVLEMFVSVSNVYEPVADGSNNNLWITSSYDATSHFESASEEILRIYEQIVGEKLDLNIEANEEDEDY
jgi:Rab GDP dissociation inhibitor